MIHSDWREIRKEIYDLRNMSYQDFIDVQEKRKLINGRQPCPIFFLTVRLKFFEYLSLSHSKTNLYLFRKYVIIYNAIAEVLNKKYNQKIQIYKMNMELKRKCKGRRDESM